jgi:hypothetical protein
MGDLEYEITRYSAAMENCVPVENELHVTMAADYTLLFHQIDDNPCERSVRHYFILENSEDSFSIKQHIQQDDVFAYFSGVRAEDVYDEAVHTSKLTDIDVDFVRKRMKLDLDQTMEDRIEREKLIAFSGGIEEKENGEAPVAKAIKVKYKRETAVNYAIEWYMSPNSKYEYFPDGDCMNFVCQCLKSGGMPNDTDGDYKWGWKSKHKYSSSFIRNKEFIKYVRYNKHYGPQIEKVDDITGVGIGDIIQLTDDGVMNPYHAMIILYFSSSGRVRIAQHTSNGQYWLDEKPSQKTYLHVVAGYKK